MNKFLKIKVTNKTKIATKNKNKIVLYWIKKIYSKTKIQTSI